MTLALLVGHPNCGKTELFNALTKSQARVGNWSGVTVELQTAPLDYESTDMLIQDLPGLYSLMDLPESEDEKLALKTVIHTQPQLIINVINACQLERQLFLTSELLELGLPMVVVLNMMNLAKAQGIRIDPKILSSHLNCPVYVFEPNELSTLMGIKKEIHSLVACNREKGVEEPGCKQPGYTLSFPSEFQSVLTQAKEEAVAAGTPSHRGFFEAIQHILQHASYPDADLIIANARYTAVHEIAQAVQTQKQEKTDQLTAKLDHILLNRYLGLPLFLLTMYSLFFISIQVGGFFQNCFDQTSDFLFVQLPTRFLHSLHCPTWVVALVSDGLGKGLNTTLTFIPVLGTLYFCLTFLESSGYMARAAFVMDRCMRALGLPGKAFVPLIIGFGCNVPAILATRTLESKRDRYLTIFMAPFMSCSARLTIYTVFVSAFFPENGQNLIFCLYLLGVLVAILTGLILQKTCLPSQLTPLLLELPAYHKPHFKRLWTISFHRLIAFLKRAAKLILPICLLLSLANLIPPPYSSETYPSLLAFIGHQLTPFFTPIGISAENWPATVGLLSGVLAKEVVIGSLNTLYEQMGHLSAIAQPAHVMIKQHFTSAASIYAYLTFILLYLPCVSTMAAIKQETSSSWMWFSITWSFGVAYGLAVVVYQACSFMLHPLTSLVWIGSILLGLAGVLYSLRFISDPMGERHAV